MIWLRLGKMAGSGECGKMWGISWLAEKLSVSQEGLCSME